MFRTSIEHEDALSSIRPVCETQENDEPPRWDQSSPGWTDQTRSEEKRSFLQPKLVRIRDKVLIFLDFIMLHVTFIEYLTDK